MASPSPSRGVRQGGRGTGCSRRLGGHPPGVGADGSFNTEFGLQPGTGAAAAGEDLEFPQGIAISAAGNIYIADSGNNRVVEYSPPPSWNEAAK